MNLNRSTIRKDNLWNMLLITAISLLLSYSKSYATPLEIEKCGSCHRKVADNFPGTLHGGAGLSCLDCHTNATFKCVDNVGGHHIIVKKMSTTIDDKTVIEMCSGCHITKESSWFDAKIAHPIPE